MTQPAVPTIERTTTEKPSIVTDVDTNTGDHDTFAHIVRKNDATEATVMGTPITALCGKTWVPCRDPERYTICEACKKVLAELRAANNN